MRQARRRPRAHGQTAPTNDQILIDRNAHTTQFVLFQDVRESAHLFAMNVPAESFYPNSAISGLPLKHQIVLCPAVVFGIILRLLAEEDKGMGAIVTRKA